MGGAMEPGRLYVVSGPSGVGKGTVLARLKSSYPRIWGSVSATTRTPREGERDGIDYFFLDREEFEREVDEGGFLEWAEYAGNLYGTPLERVRERIEQGYDVILEIEVQGALQVKEKMPECRLVFIEPPSFEELENRLRSRGTEDEETITRRLKTAELELEKKMEYDIQLVNDDIDRAVSELASYMGKDAADRDV